MKQHAAMGGRILHGSPSAILRAGEVIALSHHERWDGRGCPRGLAGEEIPIEGRICAVADVFDALTSDRPYQQAVENEEVFEVMEVERGRHFDPAILDILLGSRAEVEGIQQAYGVAHSSR